MLTSSSARHYIALLSPSETGRSALETEAAPHSTVPVAQAMSHHHVGSSMLENLDFSSSFSPTHGHQTFRLLRREGAKWSDLG